MGKDKKSSAATPAVAAESQQEQQPDETQGPRKIPRHKRKQPEDESLLLPEEAARRRRQKELREIALKLRSHGKEYNHKKYRHQSMSELSNGSVVLDGHKPRRHVDVIIVPIFWNSREEEKSLVLNAATQAQASLRSAGVKCDTDTTHKLTPGQKFRHWEERGVMVRVEIGPQEAEAGVCLLAHCKTVGEVADKKRVRLGAPLVVAVGAALGVELDSSLADGAKEKSIGFVASQQQQQWGGSGGAGGGDYDTVEKEEKKKKRNVKSGSFGASGDDLDGDFNEEMLLVGGAEEGNGKKKSQKTKFSSSDDEEDAEDDEEVVVKKKKKEKKSSKIVTF